MITISALILILVSIFNSESDASQTVDSIEWVEIKNSGSLFKIYVPNDGSSPPSNLKLELHPENHSIYDELYYDPTQNAVVVLPLFTASAYSNPGFYSYYSGDCDESCLTVPLIPDWKYTSSEVAIQTLSLLKYPLIDDYLLSKNPELLRQYDTVFLLHNEYVTKSEFDAITKHPNVVYLYPNSLYAEVNLNSDDTITLIRGHNYPKSDIQNGFDWKFDNSPLEYDSDCKNLEFYEIDNGWMLNCYPEDGFDVNASFLKFLKNLPNRAN